MIIVCYIIIKHECLDFPDMFLLMNMKASKAEMILCPAEAYFAQLLFMASFSKFHYPFDGIRFHFQRLLV